MIEALLVASLSVAAPHALPQHAQPDFRREARRAAHRYESLLRRRAPARHNAAAGTECDEIIGRFCFHFSDDGPAPHDTTPEHPSITTARGRAIRAHRAWLSSDPSVAEAAGPLVRYLLEAGRGGEAAALARTHAWAAGRDPASLLLLGLALHESGAFAAAESVFDSARAALPEPERRRLDDVEVLLEPDERRAYGRLPPGDREAYNRRFWRFSDPSLLEAGNERRSAHYARHAWAAILSEAPRVTGRPSWSGDTEEIVLRYGVPTRRERVRQHTVRLHTELSMMEIFDPHAVSFVPGALIREGLPGTPDPGVKPEVERSRVASSYAPVRLHRVRGLSVQAARFPVRGGAVLSLTGRLEADTTVPPPVSPEGLLVVLDTMGHELARGAVRTRVGPDSSTWVTGEVGVGTGAWVYRLEVKDDSTGRVGLAQYRLDVEEPGLPGLSDLLMALPEDAIPPSREGLTPVGSAVLPLDVSVLIWAEVRGLTRRSGEARYTVEWWVESAEPGTVLGRAARWVGRKMGLVGEGEPVRVRWDGHSRESPAPVAFGVDFSGLDPGLYRLGLSVRDRVSARTATATRLVRLDPSAPALPARRPD